MRLNLENISAKHLGMGRTIDKRTRVWVRSSGLGTALGKITTIAILAYDGARACIYGTIDFFYLLFPSSWERKGRLYSGVGILGPSGSMSWRLSRLYHAA